MCDNSERDKKEGTRNTDKDTLLGLSLLLHNDLPRAECKQIALAGHMRTAAAAAAVHIQPATVISICERSCVKQVHW